MISALADNRAVVIYPTGSRGVGEPIVYTAYPSSCRGARHLAFDHRGRLRRSDRFLFFAAVTVHCRSERGHKVGRGHLVNKII